MSKIIIGSARSDERGKLTGGKVGDQKQGTVTGDDYKGEVSLQNFYLHKKGWYVLRLKDPYRAEQAAIAMRNACNNPNIGYDQGNRLNILKNGTKSTVKTECDCSALVRQCIIEATGKDTGNFTTQNEAVILEKSGLFNKRQAYKNGMELYNGDVLVTKSKGHTVIVVTGKPRVVVDSQSAVDGISSEYYPRYFGTTSSLTDALVKIGANGSFENRAKIAKANGIKDYTGTAPQNLEMLDKLKKGVLIKP